MFVVEFDSRPGSGARTLPDGMRVVEAQQAFTVTIVQSQLILQTVWFSGVAKTCFTSNLIQKLPSITNFSPSSWTSVSRL